MTCDKLELVQEWAQSGRGATLDLELTAHCAECRECSELFRDVSRIRALVEDLPVHDVPRERVNAMRFEILAASRRETEPAALQRRARMPAKAAGAMAAVATLLFVCGAVFAVARGRPAAAAFHAPSVRRAPSTGVAPSPPVHGAVTRGAPTAAPPSNVAPPSRSHRAEHASVASSAQRARATPAPGRQPKSIASAARPALGDYDERFAAALALLRGNRAAEAARLFDALSHEQGIDAGRRGDALFWAARAHASAGDPKSSAARAGELVEQGPGSWHAEDATLLAARALLSQGQHAAARVWLERALRSARASVRDEARLLLDRLAAN